MGVHPVGDGADGADLGEVGHLPAGGGHGQVRHDVRREIWNLPH